MRTAAIAVMILVSATSSFAYKESAWIPPWNAEALKSMQSNVGVLSESNPVWYSWNADGTIATNWNAEDATWRAAMTGTLLVPTLQNVVNGSFNGSIAASVLATSASREAAAASIAELAISKSYDGIDVDYEALPTASRTDFTAFLNTVGQKLHAAGKKLSVSVYAKTSDQQNWDGPGAEDWQAIGQVADSVKIMAYDYSYPGSAPGPIAPLDWIDKVASYAEGVIPAGKIMMALPWYGYDWSAAGTKSLSYAAATQLALNNDATVSHDANGEATFTFADHTVFFQDAAAYSRKVTLLEQHHPYIGGFAAWSAGVEDPLIWSVIRGSGTSPASPPPPAPAGMAISGPSSLTTTRGGSSVGSYQLIAVNGFSGTAAVSVDPPAGFVGSVTAESASVASGQSFNITAATAAATQAGTYQFQIRLTSGNLSADQTVTLVVTSPARRRAAR
ncbi:MAG TPA: glycosyl hydrolase family 18 protein [Thermoanaerobaculia bacterium]|nr:glycosyl hydrolase family 18 protein [Thermoanaerobaculia bacterium]